MTAISERKQIVEWLEEAMNTGANKTKSCQIVGIHPRTFSRWKPRGLQTVTEDQRPYAPRPTPANKLTEQEQQEVLKVANSSPYEKMPPSQIVPKLADLGIYLASESTFYRVLKSKGQVKHRGRSRQRRSKPKEHLAKGPNQVWTWDISYLPKSVIGQYFYLYMVQDVYSRYGVAWEIHEVESGELGAELIERAVLKERCFFKRPVLHSDNGAPMRSKTMLSKLRDLGITPSNSRPRVSNDNPFVESFFKTLKYCPQWPEHGFKDIDEARKWVDKFMQWYNHEHQHSGIKFVTPAQRHHGLDSQILKQRTAVYQAAREQHPERWAGPTRDWTPCGIVALNPDKITREA